MGPRVTLPEAISQVFITDELHRRAPPNPDYLQEKLAIQDLASQMSDHPGEVLPRLVTLAMKICGADSAGISILEPQSEQFRWFALSGVLARFEGATTPRNFSPCGVCLDRNGPVLMDRPERAYDWIRDANITVPEVLLVPLRVKDSGPIGTLWIVADEAHHFHDGHARVMTELATFAGMALRMIQTEERLSVALQQQELLTKEMSHRVKNLFAITDSMIRMSARNSETKEQFATSLSGRLHALASANALVRRTFAVSAPEGVNFGELIQRVLQPHERTPSVLRGPDLALGEHATNHLALVFHELATNSAKYGALSTDAGSVAVNWSADDKSVELLWKEVGGPITKPPATTGFGSKLVLTTIKRIGGVINFDWEPQGLTARLQLPRAGIEDLIGSSQGPLNELVARRLTLSRLPGIGWPQHLLATRQTAASRDSCY